eukprot:7643829-Lingulodinium_polyedra.AAC.1
MFATAAVAQFGFILEQHGVLGEVGADQRLRSVRRSDERNVAGQQPRRQQRNIKSNTRAHVCAIES